MAKGARGSGAGLHGRRAGWGRGAAQQERRMRSRGAGGAALHPCTLICKLFGCFLNEQFLNRLLLVLTATSKSLRDVSMTIREHLWRVPGPTWDRQRRGLGDECRDTLKSTSGMKEVTLCHLGSDRRCARGWRANK